MRPNATSWLTLVILAMMSATSAFGQGATTAAISGRVTDAQGETLPGATIVATHVPTGTEYATVTRSTGQYDLLNLRAGGPYAIRITFIGFSPLEETGFQLTLGQTRQLDFQLQEETAQLAEVEVIGQTNSVLNSERTGASTNVDTGTLENLPTITRELTDITRLSPHASGGSSLAGRNNRFNNIQIDGATMNDVFGLSGTGVPGGQAGAQPISFDAIQEVTVDIAPYDVRYNGFTGGSINMVTKSGSNNFSGSLRYLTRNERFVGDREIPGSNGETISSPYGEFNESFLVGTLGGPIVRNKLFFFANAEVERRSAPIEAGILGSGAANIFPVAPDVLDRIIDISENEYGYNPGGYDPISDARDNVKLLGRLDWNIDTNNRLMLRHSYVDAQEDDGISRNTENFDLSNRLFLRDEVTNSTVAELRTTFGSRAFNQARLTHTRIKFARNVDATPFPYVRIDATQDEAVYLGIDRFSQANELDQFLWEFTNDFNYVTGRHNITVGTSNQLFQFRNLFLQDYYGGYEFDSIEDYAIGRPSRYYFSYSLLEDEPRPEAEFGALQLGLYVQDQISVTPTLTVTAGLRVDAPFFLDEPLYNQQAETSFGIDNTDVPNGNLLWSPRLGFNWDASGGARTTQLRGGTGIFSGKAPFVWISNAYSNSGVDVARVDVRAGDFESGQFPAGFFEPSADPSAQPRPGTAPGLEPITTTEINLTDSDLRFPQVWRTDLAIDQQLPFGFVGTLEGVYSKSINDITYRNLNITPQGETAGGRVMYGTVTYDEAANRTSVTTPRVDENFTNVLLLENTNKGYTYSITAGLRNQTDFGLDGSLFYTYNRAENLNNATSSRAISNWQYNEAVDINNPELGTADFEVRNRILGYLGYRTEYGNRFASRIGLVYEGRSGSPFTWIYNGNANGDVQAFSDPIYVPASADDIRLLTDNWDALNAFIESEPSLREARGEIVERNSARAPWRNYLDLQFTQEIETLRGQRLELTANILNVLNLLNSDWGRIQYVENDNVTLMTFHGYETDGRPIVSFNENQADRGYLLDSDLISRWQLQFGVRYTF